MTILNRVLIVGAAAVAAAAPAVAQRGGAGRPPAGQQGAAPKPDTTKKIVPGVGIDFQDQDLKVVLDAMAAAGELNVSLTDIPQKRVSLHMGRPVNREDMAEIIKSYAESQGLKVTATPGLMQIVGPAPEPVNRQQNQPSLAQQILTQQQQQQMRLFTVRLKHASAVQLAPVLMNLFSGYSGGRGNGNTTVIPNGNGGFNIIGTGGLNTPTPPGNITTNNIPAPFAGGGGGGGAGGGGGGGANNGRGGRGANNQNLQTLNNLANAFQQVTGSLSNQSGDIRIIAEESSNSLLVRATESDFQLVQQVIGGVDLRPLQVLIEVTIAEVQRNHDLDFGVSGTIHKTPGNKGFDSSFVGSQASSRDFILQLTGGHGSVKYDVAVAALESRGDVRVLSLPVIIAQNNRQAVLNVGSSRPFVQVSQTVPNDPTGRVQTVQYIDVATTLTITPTINPDGYVNLQVSQTDNSASNEVQFDAPVINKREATTQVFIRDGQTTVIGGLADNQKTHQVSGIPFLSRIPIIGSFLFGQTIHNDDTSELFLFLTPHIISSDEDIDKYRDAVRDGSDLLKHVDIGPHIVPAADTIKVKMDSAKPPSDSARRADSLRTLRRRPPGGQNDSVPPVTLTPIDTPRVKPSWR
jgi:type II secretory pathway component GspD/PulD (secretin)